MHLRVDGCSSHRETPSAALLRCCCRATCANIDPARTCPIHGRHQWRMARSVANVQRAHSLRAPGSSLWSGLRCGAEASTSDGLFPLTGADPFSGFHRFSPFHFLSLSGKEISAYGRGGIGSSRRLLFQRSSVPPRSPLHYQLENGGAITGKSC